MVLPFVGTKGKKPYAHHRKYRVSNAKGTKLELTMEIAAKIDYKTQENHLYEKFRRSEHIIKEISYSYNDFRHPLVA